ncbi:M-phase inducer phosphatase-like [Gigantopelta aegis]|uniref:M-phase inducer phosphatase-like n=1 Tax=Gigantopelta aegis TaxID=1735272 RepID=UPI001B88D4EE|nr:M-phase inducer phosphatase-like [Gigantopelta aegis]
MSINITAAFNAVSTGVTNRKLTGGLTISMLPDFDDCDMDAGQIFLLNSPGSSTSGYFSTDDEAFPSTADNKLQEEMDVDLTPLDCVEGDWHETLQKRLSDNFCIRTPLRRSGSLDIRKKLFQSQSKIPFPCIAKPKRGCALKRPLNYSPEPKTERSSSVLRAESRIKEAVETLTSSEMIADGSKGYALSTIPGKHKDLKSISSQTLSNLLSGHYDNDVDEYAIVDCRYPYEYIGGHIQSAVNLFTFDDVSALLEKANQKRCDKRRIIIFHCEFSSHRAPRIMRHLRSLDRARNSDRYPQLFFPEIYLLEGGYNVFYEEAEELCEPRMYTPMLHKDHSSDLRHFRQKAKSWTAGEKKKTLMRSLRY